MLYRSCTGIIALVIGFSQLLIAAEPVDLLAEAQWQYSTDEGKSFRDGPVTVAPDTKATVIASARFEVPASALEAASAPVALEVQGQSAPRSEMFFTLNGQKLKGPMEMYYRTIPAVDPKLLKSGSNTLQVDYVVNNQSRGNDKAKDLTITAGARVLALTPEHLAIQSGPVMGMSDAEFFTLTCRTNVPAKVAIEAKAPEKGLPPIVSDGTLFHRLSVPRKYSPALLTATVGGHTIRQSINAPAWKPDALQFIALGDTRSNPDDWRKVAAAANTHNAHLVIITGDLTVNGPDDASWDREFFGPAHDLLSSTPAYPVIGNHEHDCPLYDEMFYTPGEGGKQRNWSQQIGGTLFIGIDGAQDWSAGGANAKWLENRLENADDAKFIFLSSHYPAWSSSSHGKVDENNLPREKAMLQMRQTVAPLLEKHKATAMFVGHDHTYERSEVGGVTHITTGGGGAPRYQKSSTAQKQNPHSVTYNPALHYCLITVGEDTCTMKVYTPDGEQIDTREWAARPVGALAR